MAHNTKIAESKLYTGVRLPFQQSNIGNGYANPSPVKTYTLPPEEIERIFARAKKPEGKPPIHWKSPYQRKEAEKLPAIEPTEKEAQKILTPEVIQNCTPADSGGGTPDPEPAGQPEPDKLTKDIYLAMKANDKSDREVSKQFHGKYSPFTMTALKRDWGIDIRPVKSPKEKTKDVGENPAASNAKIEHRQELSIDQALKRRDELALEVQCADLLLDPNLERQANFSLVSGIRLVINGHRCKCAQQLKKIQDALEKVTISI